MSGHHRPRPGPGPRPRPGPRPWDGGGPHYPYARYNPWGGYPIDPYFSTPTIVVTDPEEERKRNAVDLLQQREINQLRSNQNAANTTAVVVGLGVFGVLSILGVAWVIYSNKKTPTVQQ